MTRITAIGALALGLVLGIGALAFSSSAPVSGPPLGSLGAQEAAEIDTSSVAEMALGAADAPVTVIEYASYTCPHCATFHAGPFKQLLADYVETGSVRFVYREVYFDRFGLWASMVARCGGEERFFGITELLYDQQRDWARGEPADVAAALRRIGLTAGLEPETLDACLSDAGTAETLVAWYRQNAEADDVTATPSFVINGQKYSNMSYQDMAGIIDGLLEE
jgi:protein-disulfide isomerase